MPLQTILLIDYDPVTVEYTRNSLMEAGYAVEVAADGVSGLECFERIRPDLVVVEAMIPKRHGFEVCRAIKGSSADCQAIPVVITTSSFSGRKHRDEAINTYGCDEYLEKPIGKQRLISICRGLLEGPTIDSQTETASEPLPELDEMNEDQLTAELDRLVPDVEGEQADAPLATSDRPDEAVRVDPAAGAEDVVVGPTEAALARLSGLTEEEIISRLETVLTKEDSRAGLDELTSTVPDDAVSESETPAAAELTGGDKMPAVDEPEAAVHGADVTRHEARDKAARVEQASATPPATTVAESPRSVSVRSEARARSKPDAVEKTASPRRPAVMWMGIAAGVVILISAGWFGLGWLGNDAPEESGIDSSRSAAFTSTREPVTRAPVQFPVETEDAGPSAFDTVGLAALGPPTTSTLPTLPPDAAVERSGVNGATDAIPQPWTPRPRTPQPKSRRRTTTGSPDTKRAKPAAQVTRDIPVEIPAQDRPAETAVAEPTPPKPGMNVASADLPGKETGSALPAIAAPARPGDSGETSLGTEASPAAEPLETDTAAVNPSLGEDLPPTDSGESEPADDLAIDPLNIVSSAPAGEAEENQAAPEPPRTIAGSLVPVEDVDRAPVIVTRTTPRYHPFARRLKQQGTVELRLLIDEQGRVAEVELVRGIPNSRLNDEALRAARDWAYEPAVKDGVPVKVWIPARVEFRL